VIADDCPAAIWVIAVKYSFRIWGYYFSDLSPPSVGSSELSSSSLGVGTTLKRMILQADEIDLLTGEILEIVGGDAARKLHWGGELAV